jgi:alpha-ketoglutarate-dependent taurine dioxygenase
MATIFSPLVEVRPRAGQDSFAALLERVEGERDEFDQAVLSSGVLLIRGFVVESTEQFAELVSRLAGSKALREYRGGASPRHALPGSGGPVYNSTEYPAHIELPLHNELSYSADHPERIYFLCLVEPGGGGETTYGDSRRILQAMPRAVRSRFERLGLRYIRNLPPGEGSGYSWQDAFRSADPRVVEQRCAASGATAEWLPGEFLRVVQERPAVAAHPRTGEDVWFNQADGFHPSALDKQSYEELLALYGSEDRFRLNVHFGDGSPIDPEALAAIRAVLREESRPHAWRKGDVLVLDNMLTAHGRRPFTGARRIATAIT